MGSSSMGSSSTSMSMLIPSAPAAATLVAIVFTHALSALWFIYCSLGSGDSGAPRTSFTPLACMSATIDGSGGQLNAHAVRGDLAVGGLPQRCPLRSAGGVADVCARDESEDFAPRRRRDRQGRDGEP